VNKKEYFLSYKTFPYFKGQKARAIQHVKLLHRYHLYWPELDIDLEIDNIESPGKYPLKSNPKRHLTGRSGERIVARR